MQEPDGYAMVKAAYAAAIAEQHDECPDIDPPPPDWDRLGIGLRDAIGRVFFAGGEQALERFMVRWKEETEEAKH